MQLNAARLPASALLDPPVKIPGEPRRVLAGESDGVCWAIRAGLDAAGGLDAVVTRTYRGAAATSRVRGSSPRDGQLISMWIGRGRDIPPFLLLRAASEVTHVAAILASGDRREVALSSVIEDFGLRFGGAPLPAEDPLAGIEVGSPLRGTQRIELWRPPRRGMPELEPALWTAACPWRARGFRGGPKVLSRRAEVRRIRDQCLWRLRRQRYEPEMGERRSP